MNLLENKVCIVTGGGRGIGQATAEKFIGESATVIIADFDEATGTATAEYLGDQCSFVKTDVSQSQSVKSLIKRVKADHGSIDVIVNNAGILQDQTLEKMDEEEFDKVIQVNMRGVYLCTKYAAEVMREQGSGVILNASSVVARFGNFGQTNYVAAKAGLEGMTKVWARELGKHGIRVNAVSPGTIDTPFHAQIKATKPEVFASWKDSILLGRLGQPEEVASVVSFLVSEDASFITAETVQIGGGQALGI